MSSSSNSYFKPSKFRIITLISISSLLVIIYIIKLFSMQVMQASVYEMIADKGTRRREIINTKRGEIYDRNYDQPIASNLNSYVIKMMPLGITKAEILKEIDLLAEYLKINKDTLLKKLPEDLRLYAPVDLVADVRYEDVLYLAEHSESFKALSWENKPKRYYPYGRYLSHILGYVGEITPEELQVLYNQGYNSNSILGKNGIEKQYDADLRGKEGWRFRRVNAQGQRVEGKEDIVETDPVLGKTLVLSIDRKIQTLALKALGKRLGSVVVLKPASGEVVAMASYPTYDPNQFYTANSSEVFNKLFADSKSPFLNRGIQEVASPASTFKVIMSVANFQEELLPLSSKIVCNGWIQIGNRNFHCHVFPAGHGALDIYGALAQSCNVFFYTLGNEYLGVNKILEYSEYFGLGQVSGIDLPGEVSGLLPSPEWKEKNIGTPWVGGDTVNMSIGQGYLTVTPLQMANVVAGIVNNGTIYQPHVLKEVRDPVTFKVDQEIKPEVLLQLDLKDSVWVNIKKAMRNVIVNGTAAPVLTTRAVKIAGKTGTAQTGIEDSKHSWFISYGPSDYTDPDQVYVVVVWVDAINGWEWWAPKAANIIYNGLFKNLDYEDSVRDLQPYYYLTEPETYDPPLDGAQ